MRGGVGDGVGAGIMLLRYDYILVLCCIRYVVVVFYAGLLAAIHYSPSTWRTAGD